MPETSAIMNDCRAETSSNCEMMSDSDSYVSATETPDVIRGKAQSLLYRIFPNRKTLTLQVGIAAVQGAKPLVGIAEEVEKAWKKLKARFGIKERREALKNRTVSHEDLTNVGGDMRRWRRGSDVGGTLAKFKQFEKRDMDASKEDVYHPDWKPPQFDKNAEDYGRPKAGSLTEKRGIAAGHHVGKEIVQLCEVITDYGIENPDGTVIITFGALFDVYNYISDKVVGMLLRARKHKLVDFEGEMLYQRQDEHKIIKMLRPLEEIRELYNQSDDPALCLKKLW